MLSYQRNSTFHCKNLFCHFEARYARVEEGKKTVPDWLVVWKCFQLQQRKYVLIKNCDIETCERVEVEFHVFLTRISFDVHARNKCRKK